MERMHIINRALGLLALAAILTMLLVACGGEGSPTATQAAWQAVAPPTVEGMMEEAAATPEPTPTPIPEPTPVVLGDCRDGMRLQLGEGCRYTGGGSPPANVVLSVQHNGAICREGGPVKQGSGSITINMDSLRLCGSGGFERDDAFQSEIVVSANADGSWTFYESALSASAPRSTATAAPTDTPTPAPPLNVYESGQTIPDFPSGFPNVVRGGASLQMVGGNFVITMGNGGTVEYSHATYTCVSGEGCGIENGLVTTGTIRVADPSDVENPTPIPTATATPGPTAAPTATPVRPGRFSEFNGAGAAVWQRMHGSGQIVACYEGLALPRDSFCLSEGFRFTPDYSELLDTKFLVAHLPDGDALVLRGNTTSRAGGDIKLGWITFENRVITHLEYNASQTSTPVATATATATPKPTATPTRAQSGSDRAVLVALYHSTGGPNWKNNANWLSNRPIGEWHGVTTNSNGRVIQLGLSDNGLTGEIPPELGRLSNLTRLYFYNNQLTGEIPPVLGRLSNLWWMDLNVNQLTGGIPPELGRLSDLGSLFLGGNQLTGEISPELGRLSNLTYLGLHDNRLTGGIPPELGRLSNLTRLWLYGNQLTGEIPPELGRLSNLTHLFLNVNQLTGEIPPELDRLSNLTVLFLNDNRLTGCIPEGLREIAENDLVELSLPHCGAATLGETAAPIPTPERAGGVCHVGLIVRPGESCTYPGTTSEFSVDSSGTGRFLFFTAGTGIDARNTTINGVTYNFKASKQGDGNWIIEAAGDS